MLFPTVVFVAFFILNCYAHGVSVNKTCESYDFPNEIITSDQLEGKWYLTASSNPNTSLCSFVEFSTKNQTISTSSSSFANLTGSIQDNSTTELSMNYESETDIFRVYIFKNLSILWSCSDLNNETSNQILWILSRNHSVNQSSIEEAATNATVNDIHLTYANCTSNDPNGSPVLTHNLFAPLILFAIAMMM